MKSIRKFNEIIIEKPYKADVSWRVDFFCYCLIMGKVNKHKNREVVEYKCIETRACILFTVYLQFVASYWGRLTLLAWWKVQLNTSDEFVFCLHCVTASYWEVYSQRMMGSILVDILMNVPCHEHCPFTPSMFFSLLLQFLVDIYMAELNIYARMGLKFC